MWRAGTVLTRCLQCSAQCFTGESGDLLTGMCEWGRIFNAGFAVFCAGFRRGERVCGERRFASGDVASGGVRAEMC